MYCGKCGNKAKDSDIYCEKCGSLLTKPNINNGINQTQQVNISNTPVQPVKRSKKSSIVFAILLPIILMVGVFGTCFVIFILAFIGIISDSNNMYVNLSGDSIPTVYNVLGERNVCNYDSSTYGDEMVVTYEYCDNELSSSDYDEYIDYLISNEGFTNVDQFEFSYVTLIKESSNDDMYLVVEIDRVSDYIKYYKEELTLGNI